MIPPHALIGMIHLQPLPGSPRARLSVDEICARAAQEARLLARAGFDALMIENMHDTPYINAPHPPETVAVMTAAALAVRQAVPDLPLGVQVLSLGGREALGIALAAGGSFIRVENFVFAHVADEGLMPTAQAGDLLRARRTMGAESIRIFADIQKKHASHAITADMTVGELAKAAEFSGAEAVIVTGLSTGEPASLDDLRAVRQATRLPVLVGSGVTPQNIAEVFRWADSVIVGSFYKKDGRWFNPPDPQRAAELVKAARQARKSRAKSGSPGSSRSARISKAAQRGVMSPK